MQPTFSSTNHSQAVPIISPEFAKSKDSLAKSLQVHVATSGAIEVNPYFRAERTSVKVDVDILKEVSCSNNETRCFVEENMI